MRLQTQHQGRHGADQAHTELDHILGVGTQVMVWKSGAEHHPQERTAKDAREGNAAYR
jgi:hypothetical protein